MTKVFFDCEFTGLQQNTTLISLGCVAEDGREFYAEFTDYDRKQINPWLEENVIEHLTYRGMAQVEWSDGGRMVMKDDRHSIAAALQTWLSQFDHVEMWSDVLAYDWMLFCELFDAPDTAERLPRNVYYIPFDIATLMKIKNVDPDISREELSGIENLAKHNALDDARIIKACYEKLIAL